MIERPCDQCDKMLTIQEKEDVDDPKYDEFFMIRFVHHTYIFCSEKCQEEYAN